MSEWIIKNREGHTWNNQHGWGIGLNWPSVFTDLERSELRVPIDGFWEQRLTNIPPTSEVRPHGIFACDDSGADKEQIAWVQPCPDETARRILDLAPIGNDARSDFFWMRLVDGTLVLGVFPQGATYEEFGDDIPFEHVETTDA